jgi:adenylyltransferase/sulfurtransferase
MDAGSALSLGAASTAARDVAPPRRRVAVVGAGNIGSHVVSLLARLSHVAHVTIIDRDVYEEKNLLSQDIVRSDVGKPKAKVQSRRARRLNSALTVDAVVADLVDVPPGVLRADVILGCVDSRAARLEICRRAWRLGIPFLDAGVEAMTRLARMTPYIPGADSACIECLWSAEDYDTLEPAYTCAGDAITPAATDAPAFLGGLAASLLVAALQDLFTCNASGALAGNRELVLDATHQRSFSTQLHRNRGCRFDHSIWTLVAESSRTTLGRMRERAEGTPTGWVYLSVFSQRFTTGLVCRACGHDRRLLHLARRLGPSHKLCPDCGGETALAAFRLLDRLELSTLPAPLRRRSLASLGLRPGDLVTLASDTGERHFEIVGRHAEAGGA